MTRSAISRGPVTDQLHQVAKRSPLLDPVLVSECSVGFSEVVDIDRSISDHNATVVEINVNSGLNKCSTRKIWLYELGDYDQFCTKLDNVNWEDLLLEPSVDEACEVFTDIFFQSASETIPTKDVTIRPNDKPWFNSQLRREMRKRDRLRKKAKTGNQYHVNKYKKQRNHVNNLKKTTKQEFYAEAYGLVDQFACYNQKGFWKLVKMLIRTSGKSETIPPLLNPVTQTIESDDKEKANLLNEYFVSISTMEDNGIDLPEMEYRTDEILHDINIDIEAVLDILKILKIGKASGADKISHQMLKYTANSVARPLMILFNKCLECGIFPQTWKKAIVMPLYKKDEKHFPSNYRPISLLSCVGKVFERIIFKNIHNFLLDHSLIYDMQSGFLPNHSTVYQLLEIFHNICISREEKKHTGLVFCDVSKAFDRVWHRGLIYKLKHYGIGGKLLDLLENYISDRHQCVFINASLSDTLFTNAGVPQGSVLGPIMFLIYINDIADNLVSITRLFADDTSLSSSSRDPNEIEDTLNKDLSEINNWSQKWLVKFNPSKTEVLLISNSLIPPDIHINFANENLELSDFHKHLGVIFSANGKWTKHIETIRDSAMKSINILRKLKYTLSRKTLNKIYNTFILPLLEYACEVWDGCSKQDEEKLEKVHLEAARIITGLPIYASRESLYKETGWEKLKQRRERRKLCLFHKIHYGIAPSYLTEITTPLRRQEGNYNLRGNDDYNLPLYRLESTMISFFPSTIKLWNNLNRETRDIPIYNSFKNIIKSNYDIQNVPIHLCVGDRKSNILSTKLRNRCSELNADLFRVNLIDSAACSCGCNIEDANHFIFNCTKYQHERQSLLRSLGNFHPITLDMLLFEMIG